MKPGLLSLCFLLVSCKSFITPDSNILTIDTEINCPENVLKYIDGIPIEGIFAAEKHVIALLDKFDQSDFYTVIMGRTGVLYSSILRLKKIPRKHWAELPYTNLQYILYELFNDTDENKNTRNRVLDQLFFSKLENLGDRQLLFLRALMGGSTVFYFFRPYAKQMSFDPGKRKTAFVFYYAKTPSTESSIESTPPSEIVDFLKQQDSVSFASEKEEPDFASFIEYVHTYPEDQINNQLFEKPEVSFFGPDNLEGLNELLSRERADNCYKALDKRVASVLGKKYQK